MVNGMPRLMCEMVLCPKCGDKRCPHADDHHNDCATSSPETIVKWPFPQRRKE